VSLTLVVLARESVPTALAMSFTVGSELTDPCQTSRAAISLAGVPWVAKCTTAIVGRLAEALFSTLVLTNHRGVPGPRVRAHQVAEILFSD